MGIQDLWHLMVRRYVIGFRRFGEKVLHSQTIEF